MCGVRELLLDQEYTVPIENQQVKCDILPNDHQHKMSIDSCHQYLYYCTNCGGANVMRYPRKIPHKHYTNSSTGARTEILVVRHRWRVHSKGNVMAIQENEIRYGSTCIRQE
mmetsp:Transcript_64282/g.71855  ORF Transcript_64282/g.71855 Transcript_64282/m.71855 type:complete len:112 (-) Transcript_64282:102-437(-)